MGVSGPSFMKEEAPMSRCHATTWTFSSGAPDHPSHSHPKHSSIHNAVHHWHTRRRRVYTQKPATPREKRKTASIVQQRPVSKQVPAPEQVSSTLSLHLPSTPQSETAKL